MFAHFNHPQSHVKSGFIGCEPRPCSSKSTNQFEQSVDFADILDAILTAATVVDSLTEPRISAHMKKPSSTKCNTKTEKSHLVSTTDNTFEIKLDVNNFSPEEINVKVVDNCIVIEAKHEEKEDKYGFISRQFVRRFVIPEGVILEKMECKMSSTNSTILISAPRRFEKPSANDRSIPINFVEPSEPSSPSSELKNVSTPSNVSSSEINHLD